MLCDIDEVDGDREVVIITNIWVKYEVWEYAWGVGIR
jgi:hypothetical protein